MTLTYFVPSRIAIDLYDMNGDLGRIDGSMGFSVEHPRLVFNVRPQDTLELRNASLLGEELAIAVQTSLMLVQQRYALPGAIIEFQESIPAHIGFGSKTATLLSTAHALGTIHGFDLDYRMLAFQLGRGGTSGLGVNLIDKGGFVLDGGHSVREKHSLLPSSASIGVPPPPMLAHYSMPEWPILLVRPHSQGLHGAEEVAFFSSVCPVPGTDIECLARVTLSQILPAVAEGDLETFCDGVNRIQSSIWKSSEIALHGRKVQDLLEELRSRGARGVGMSSVGPVVYAIGGDLQRIKECISDRYPFVLITAPNNTGVRIVK